MPKRQPEDVSRPAVLYVETVETNPNVEQYFESRRLSVIDIEIDMIHAADIVAHLQTRIGQPGGAVRLRFKGRLIHL